MNQTVASKAEVRPDSEQGKGDDSMKALVAKVEERSFARYVHGNLSDATVMYESPFYRKRSSQ